jgi:PII-like signaling protein
MEITGQAVLLRVFVGESDKLGHMPLYEAVVRRARDTDLAGATVLKGVMGFGATARIRTQKILDLSSDLPMLIEIVDEQEKIEGFKAVLSELFEEARCGALVTMENIRVVHYLPGNKHR